MPTYDYHCTECGHKLEAMQKITADPLKTCPKCSKETLLRGPGGGIGLQFRGSGFYKTDYCCGKNKEPCHNPEKKECCCKKEGSCCE